MSVIAVSLKTQNRPYCFELTVVGPGWLGELIVVEEESHWFPLGSCLDHVVDRKAVTNPNPGLLTQLLCLEGHNIPLYGYQFTYFQLFKNYKQGIN